MTNDPVEIVRRWYQAYNDRDLDQLLALMHPQVDATSAGMSGVEGTRHRGHAGIRRYFRDLWETWEDPRVEVEELLDHGDEVVMLGRTTGRGRRSKLDVVEPVATVITVVEDVILRYRTYRSWDEALAESRDSVTARRP